LGILLEEMRDQNKVILEMVGGLPTRKEFDELRDDVAELEAHVKVVKAAVTDLSRHVDNHERRITRLEAA
jgi:hypothetical protein